MYCREPVFKKIPFDENTYSDKYKKKKKNIPIKIRKPVPDEPSAKRIRTV